LKAADGNSESDNEEDNKLPADFFNQTNEYYIKESEKNTKRLMDKLKSSAYKNDLERDKARIVPHTEALNYLA
jgi:hypothetical protein